jgi:septal ring factor EnvC (AmiA/AmiB activator)
MQEINKQKKALTSEEAEEKRLQSLIKLIAPSAALPVAAKVEPVAQPERTQPSQSNTTTKSNVEHASEPSKSESKPVASTFAAPQLKPKVPAIGLTLSHLV